MWLRSDGKKWKQKLLEHYDSARRSRVSQKIASRRRRRQLDRVFRIEFPRTVSLNAHSPIAKASKPSEKREWFKCVAGRQAVGLCKHFECFLRGQLHSIGECAASALTCKNEFVYLLATAQLSSSCTAWVWRVVLCGLEIMQLRTQFV